MSLKSLMVHEITHYRETRTRGTYGGSVPSPATIGTNPKRCRIQPRVADQDDRFRSMDERTTHFVYFDEDPLAQARDYFEYTRPNTGELLKLEVATSINFDELDRVWRIECIEIKKKSR